MANLNLQDLLKRALLVGAVEVRLVPGRRTIVVTAKGENEVRGEPQTPERINGMIEPVLTPEARRHLASGWAEWEFPLDDKGAVHATAEMKVGLVHASFFLDRCGDEPEELSIPIGSGAAAVPSASSSAASTLAHEATMRGGYGIEAQPPPRTDLAPQAAEPSPALRTQPPAPPLRQLHDTALSSGSTEEIDSLLLKLLELKGSDLHVSTGAPPMLRVDGAMMKIPGHPVLAPEALQRMIWPIVPPRNREEFQETHDTDFAYELEGKARFRANLFVDLKGMGCVMRVIPSKVLSVDDLKLPRELLTLCNLPKGLVLVTGPTGSGKSTTLAALIDHINSTRHDHIITIEDPVEFVHTNKNCLVNQRQVGEHTKSFKAALRAALREDPDIVLLGEMRDLETVSIAIETAETGHLVFGTLHTTSAPATVDRIIDQFPAGEQNQIRTMLSNTLKGVISQMLCKKRGGGRVAALEVMFGVPAIANLIREQKVFQIQSIMQTGRNLGMRLMNDSLFNLVKDGLVTPEEALSKANDKAGLSAMFKQNNVRVQDGSA